MKSVRESDEVRGSWRADTRVRAGIERAFVTVRGNAIHYRTAGKGRPVILLHQTIWSSTEFIDVMSILGRSFLCLAPDLPGYGDSFSPRRKPSIGEYAEYMKAFADALDLTSFSLVGNHTGAAVALDLAARWPGSVDRLVLFGCPYWRNEAELHDMSSHEAFRPLVLKRDGSHFTDVWRMYRQYLSEDAENELINSCVIEYVRAGRRGQDAHEALFKYDPVPALRSIRCPTLLLSGTADVFHEVRDEVRSKMGDARVSTIENGTLAASRETPQEYCDRIIDFLCTV